jgi:hypothetical protein
VRLRASFLGVFSTLHPRLGIVLEMFKSKMPFFKGTGVSTWKNQELFTNA